jgi:hypothetical protein
MHAGLSSVQAAQPTEVAFHDTSQHTQAAGCDLRERLQQRKKAKQRLLIHPGETRIANI